MFRWGKLGDEYGWKKVLLQLSVYILAIPLIFTLLAYINLEQLNRWLISLSAVYHGIVGDTQALTMLLLCLAFALWGIFKNSLLMARIYFTLEFNQSRLQTSYYGLTQISQQAATVIGSVIVGLSIDCLGIPGVILMGTVFQLASVVYGLTLVEPRHQKRNDYINDTL